MIKYEELMNVCNDKVKNYYDNNWHTISEQWVEGLNSKQLNLQNRTNNRLESFFQKLKSFIQVKGTMQQTICGFIDCVKLLRNERRVKANRETTKYPTTAFSSDDEKEYFQFLTPYAFKYVKSQIMYSTS